MQLINITSVIASAAVFTLACSAAPIVDTPTFETPVQVEQTELEPVDPSLAIDNASQWILETTVHSRHLSSIAQLEWALIDAHSISDLAVRGDTLVVATRGGLLMVSDGTIQSRFTTTDGLRGNDTEALLVDNQERIWVSFAGGGCQILELDEVLSCPVVLDTVRIKDWALRGDNPVALGFSGELFELVSTSEAHQIPGPAASDVPFQMTHNVLDCQDRLFVGSRGFGLGILEADGSWRVDDRLRFIEDMACQGERVFLGGPEGLFELSGNELTAETFSGPRRHVTLVATGQSYLTFALADGSFWHRLGDDTQYLDLGQAVHSPTFYQGELWLAGEHALIHFDLEDPEAIETFPLPGPGSTDVAAIATQGQRLALGLFSSGVAIWANNRWLRIVEGQENGLPSNFVNSVVFDSIGNLWVATSRGLVSIDPNGSVTAVIRSPDAPCDHINAVIVSPSDGVTRETIIVGSSCGVGWVDAASASVIQWEGRLEGLPHRIVYAVALWENVVVAGTNDGLAVRDGDTEPDLWTTYRAGTSALTDNWITALASTSAGELVVGTYSRGLFIGDDPTTLEPVDSAQYVNLNAIFPTLDSVFVGGLSEGAYLISDDGVRHLNVGECLVGADVTGFASWGDDEILASTRSGVGLLPTSCLRY